MPEIKIINNTTEVLRIAVFKKSLKQPTLESVAWRIAEPPPNGGSTRIRIPARYETFVSYSFRKEERDVPGTGNQTLPLEFEDATFRALIDAKESADGKGQASVMTPTTDRMVFNEVRLENIGDFGVWGHIQKDGADIFPPRFIPPKQLLAEDVRSPLWLRVVEEYVGPGDLIEHARQEEWGINEAGVLEGGTMTVTGSKYVGGYSFATS